MNRITERNLQYVLDQINAATSAPLEPWSTIDGKRIANIGNYHLAGAYDGWNVEQMYNAGGGVTQPLGGGFYTKRELYGKLQAFLAGIETGKQVNE